MRELDPALEPEIAFVAMRRPDMPSLMFDGRGGHDGAWSGRLAIEPRVLFDLRIGGGDPSLAMGRIGEVVKRRRESGGAGGTGVAVLCAYEAFAPGARSNSRAYQLLALEVDGVVSFPANGPPIALGRIGLVERATSALDRLQTPAPSEAPALSSGPPRTSLGRDAYLRAVSRVKTHIVRGDVYQANLTQTFDAPFRGDAFELYRSIARASSAPRSAYVEVPGLAVASMSPEMFVDVDHRGAAETRPIKGTRARQATPVADRQAARELLESAKDRAELVMIVDVLRNDLGRVARTGTVAVPELCALRSYASVHHLVARIVAELRSEVTPAELVSAIFPRGLRDRGPQGARDRTPG